MRRLQLHMGHIQMWGDLEGERWEREMFLPPILCAQEERACPFTLPVFMWSWKGEWFHDVASGLQGGEVHTRGGVIWVIDRFLGFSKMGGVWLPAHDPKLPTYLSHFILLKELSDSVRATGGLRVIIMSSVFTSCWLEVYSFRILGSELWSSSIGSFSPAKNFHGVSVAVYREPSSPLWDVDFLHRSQ